MTALGHEGSSPPSMILQLLQAAAPWVKRNDALPIVCCTPVEEALTRNIPLATSRFAHLAPSSRCSTSSLQRPGVASTSLYPNTRDLSAFAFLARAFETSKTRLRTSLVKWQPRDEISASDRSTFERRPLFSSHRLAPLVFPAMSKWTTRS